MAIILFSALMVFLQFLYQPSIHAEERAEKGKSKGQTSESSATLTSRSFKDGIPLKVVLSEMKFRDDHFYVTGTGEMALKTAHLLDPKGQTEEMNRKLGPTTTVIIEAEAYKAPGQLRTNDDEEMIGIQGKCLLEVHLFENERGTLTAVPNIESQGLTFKNSFKKSKVKMLGSNYANIVEGTIIKEREGHFQLKQEVSPHKKKAEK